MMAATTDTVSRARTRGRAPLSHPQHRGAAGVSEAAGRVVDMKRAYTALCNTTDRERDLTTALRWALDQAVDGQRVTLWCWDMKSLPGSVVAWASSRGVIIHSERPRPRGGGSAPRPRGPVVAVDLPLERLVEIEPCPHPVALVHANAHENDEMAGWIGGEDLSYERPWLEAFQPE